MVSPSREHLFRSGHAQHVRSGVLPLVATTRRHSHFHAQDCYAASHDPMLSRLCGLARLYPIVTSAHCVCDQSVLKCLETVAGVIQVGTQWLLFSVMCVIYCMHRATTCRLSLPSQPRSLHALLSASSQICHIRH
jgi:hypothetical protein